jgi:hypothetical protein
MIPLLLILFLTILFSLHRGEEQRLSILMELGLEAVHWDPSHAHPPFDSGDNVKRIATRWATAWGWWLTIMSMEDGWAEQGAAVFQSASVPPLHFGFFLPVLPLNIHCSLISSNMNHILWIHSSNFHCPTPNFYVNTA